MNSQGGDAFNAMIDAVTRLPLGELVKRSERVRMWLARELTEEVCAYAFPTLDDVAEEMGLASREVARKAVRNEEYACTVILPSGPDRVHRADLERDVMVREIKPPPIGGSRKYVVDDELDEAARARLSSRDRSRQRGDRLNGQPAPRESGRSREPMDGRDLRAALREIGDEPPPDFDDEDGAET